MGFFKGFSSGSVMFPSQMPVTAPKSNKNEERDDQGGTANTDNNTDSNNNNNSNQTENNKDKKKNLSKRAPRQVSDIPGLPANGRMGYPIASGPNDDTGDRLLIKCLQYIPPKTGFDANIDILTANRDGTVNGVPVKKGDVLKYEPNNLKLSNQGSSDRLKNASPIYYIELPIPQDVTDSNVVTWGDDRANIFQLAGVAIASKLALGRVKDFRDAFDALSKQSVGDTFGGVDEVTKNAIVSSIAGEAINQLGGNVRPNSVLGRSAGIALNSNLELLFSGATLRTFPFSINFSPRNREEGQMVKLIIRALKSSSAVKRRTNKGQGGIFLGAPDVFELRYLKDGGDHPFLPNIKHCALTGMSVNYTNAGTYATYSDGTPVSMRMDLTFKELNPVYFEDYEKMDADGGVGF